MESTFSAKSSSQIPTPPTLILRSICPMFLPQCLDPDTVEFRASDAYFHFRAFIGSGPESARLHCIRLQQIGGDDEEKTFKAIFFQNDPLEWFDV